MKAASYLLIFCLLSAPVDDLWMLGSAEDSQTDPEDADGDDYSLAQRQDEWLSASLRRKPARADLQRPIADCRSHFSQSVASSRERLDRPSCPSILYLFMSLQR